jgi:hypothetical protein
LFCIIIPLVAAATIPYSGCYDWYDGYFAVAYGEIWEPLYYGVLVSALFCMFAFSILYCALTIRLIWAMAQPHISMLPDGTMYLENENSLMPTIDIDNLDAFDASTAFQKRENVNASNPAVGDQVEAKDASPDEDAAESVKHIPLGLLHPKVGYVWSRTGAPAGALAVWFVSTMILCTFMTYERCVQIIVYTYLATYLMVIAAYIVTKIKEPDAPRRWQIPGGQTGGLVVSISSGVILVAISIYIGVTYYYWSALMWVCFNVVFVVYYFTIKQWLDNRDRDRQYAPIDQDDRSLREMLINLTS